MNGEAYAFFRWHSLNDALNLCNRNNPYHKAWTHKYHLAFWRWGNR